MRVAVTISCIMFCSVFYGCARQNVPVNIAAVNATPTEPSPEIETNEPKIIAFGDSLTGGFGLTDPKNSYPLLLQQSLEREGFDYKVYNSGLNGDTSEGGLKRLWTALRYSNVKLFILELGANDVVKKTPASQIEPNLAAIIQQVKASGAAVILCGIIPPASYGDEYASEIREMYAALARENDVVLIPDFMKDVGGNSERMLADGIHPNEKGAIVIEQNIRSVVKPLLVKNDVPQKK